MRGRARSSKIRSSILLSSAGMRCNKVQPRAPTPRGAWWTRGGGGQGVCFSAQDPLHRVMVRLMQWKTHSFRFRISKPACQLSVVSCQLSVVILSPSPSVPDSCGGSASAFSV
ncbi:hypothetical protein BO71DRAFT_198415 [Aspergillus ellipticus CBS 707.79]|uniref:Uncharacterized protein n=1 Tax=Aspergillus ellipticus CBS 707.79 TaxID=1448320 RepID=A0A319DE25_9EURO|nr:hypothetical protein BO71DRAFT_198415 [Aspergillus ellipticus CBS 707.79]